MFRQNTLRRAQRGAAAVVALSVISVAVIGASNRSSTRPPERVVSLGGVFALSGSSANYGQTARAAMEVALEDVNRELGRNA
ncbi:MAG TPA: hypothetical protein VFJ20_04895, partial [Gemmatimonadaceae bacterium]|nr:hypothetical protein [Gemmatimonadaceae bacterium]